MKRFALVIVAAMVVQGCSKKDDSTGNSVAGTPSNVRAPSAPPLAEPPPAKPAGKPELKKLAEFTHGSFSGTHAGKPFNFTLSSGTMSTRTTPGNPSPDPITVELDYSSVDKANPGRGGVLFIMVDPKQLTDVVPMNLMVMTKAGDSRMAAPHGTCKFALTKADATGVEGAGVCTGDMWDIVKDKAAASVADLKLSATP